MTLAPRSFKKKGFTLIELLAAMGILSILLLIMAQIFSQTALAFQRGRETLMQNGEGQTIFNIISKDLEYMLVDRDFTFKKEVYDPRSLSNFGNFDKLFFITANGESQEDFQNTRSISRNVRMVGYRVEQEKVENEFGEEVRYSNLFLLLPKELGSSKSNIFDPNKVLEGRPTREGDMWFNEDRSWFSSTKLLETTVRFDVYLYSNALYGQNPSEKSSGSRANEFFSNNLEDTVKVINGETPDQDLVPPYVDFIMQVASEEGWQRAHALDPNDSVNTTQGYTQLNNNSRVFFKRVFPILGPSYRRHVDEYAENRTTWNSNRINDSDYNGETINIY